MDKIRKKFTRESFEFSHPTADQTILRDIRVYEIREAIVSGEVIEDYPEDKYGPSCLILGYTRSGRPLHLQCSHLPVHNQDCYGLRTQPARMG